MTGSALINVTPDRAFLQLGVQSNGVTVGAAQTANTVAIQRVIAAIKAMGVEAKDISTDLYVIEPIYQDYDALYIKGYRIYNTVAVTVREVNKTSEIVAASLEAGANQVNNVEFYTSELRKYRDQARELAMTAAKEKAQALAMAAGAEIGLRIEHQRKFLVVLQRLVVWIWKHFKSVDAEHGAEFNGG